MHSSDCPAPCWAPMAPSINRWRARRKFPINSRHRKKQKRKERRSYFVDFATPFASNCTHDSYAKSGTCYHFESVPVFLLQQAREQNYVLSLRIPKCDMWESVKRTIPSSEHTKMQQCLL